MTENERHIPQIDLKVVGERLEREHRDREVMYTSIAVNTLSLFVVCAMVVFGAYVLDVETNYYKVFTWASVVDMVVTGIYAIIARRG